MNPLGNHVLLELKDCSPELLNDLEYLRQTMLQAARNAGATVLGETFHQFSPQGVSGVVVVAESHLSIHTWPEFGYAAADIFTCGEVAMPEKAAQHIVKCLGTKNHSIIKMERGLIDV